VKKLENRENREVMFDSTNEAPGDIPGTSKEKQPFRDD
jgi:hypothetical protein